MDNLELLLEERFISIYYDKDNCWIYANWNGDQTKESVIYGCERMLTFLKEYNCQKILNDNTEVTSNWSDAAEWVANEWFPRMSDAGLRYFAWVYATNSASKQATDKTLAQAKSSIAITFDDKATAETWLRSV